MFQPYPGGAQMPETKRPAAPASVRNAVKVMYAGAVASLVYAIVFIATLSATKNAIAKHSPQLTTSQVNGMQHALMASAIAGGLIGAGLWIFIARACGSGKSWARITGTVLFGIATVQGGPSILVVPEAALVKIFWLVVWLVGLAAVMFLWRGTSSAFFRATSS
jgi:hypothetical protein